MREPADPLRETPPSALREARMGEGFWRDIGRNLAIAAAAGAFLAFVGALNMGDAPLMVRLLYWVPLMMLGALFGGALAQAALHLMPATRTNPWLLGLAVTLAIAVLGTGFIWAYITLFWGYPISAAGLPGFLGGVLVLSAAMTGLMILVNQPGPATHAAPPGAPLKTARFLDRLPPKLRGATLHAVEAEDHYLRLHTSKGTDLVLLRLADAIAELDGLEGAQVHRSWWVARDGFTEIRRDGGKVTLALKNGAAAPVSRPNVKALREAGWL